MSGFTIDPQRGPHIRDYSDQSQDRVIIYSSTSYWAANGCGYTTSQMAGVYTRDDAYKRAGHCGPEKCCCFYDVPADHVPTLQAEVERLREVLEGACKDLETGYWSTRTFIDENVPGWVYGDDGPSYPLIRNIKKYRAALTATAPKGEQGCQSKS